MSNTPKKRAYLFLLLFIFLSVATNIFLISELKECRSSSQLFQEKIDTQFRIAFSDLYSELYQTSPLDCDELITLSAQVSALQSFTSFSQIKHFDEIVCFFLDTAKATQISSYSMPKIDAVLLDDISNYISSLSTPLASDINEYSSNIWERLQIYE